MEHLDGASRHSGEFTPFRDPDRPAQETPLLKMMERLNTTFESLSQLNSTKANYDPQTRIFSNVGGEVAKQAGKVSSLSQSLVTGVSKMVYSYDQTMHQGFSDILAEMEAISQRLSDPAAKFSLNEIAALEISFNRCFESYKNASTTLANIQAKESKLMGEDTQKLFRKGEEMRLSMPAKFLELKTNLFMDYLRRLPVKWTSDKYAFQPEYQILANSIAITKIAIGKMMANRDALDPITKRFQPLLDRSEKLQELAGRNLVGLQDIDKTRDELEEIQFYAHLEEKGQNEWTRLEYGSFLFMEKLMHLEMTVDPLSELREEFPEHTASLMAKLQQVRTEAWTQYVDVTKALMNDVLEGIKHVDANTTPEQLDALTLKATQLSKTLHNSINNLQKNISDGPPAAIRVFAEINKFLTADVREWVVNCRIELMELRLKRIESLRTLLNDPDTEISEEQLTKLRTDLGNEYRDFNEIGEAARDSTEALGGPKANQRLDLIYQAVVARTSVLAMILEKKLELLDAKVDGLWDTDGKVKEDVLKKLQEERSSDPLRQVLLSSMELLHEEDVESRKEITALIEEYDFELAEIKALFENFEPHGVEAGLKLIDGQYGQTADLRLNSIDNLVKNIHGNYRGWSQRKLLRLCVEEITQLSYEFTDPAKVEAFYAEKKRVLNVIREFQEKEHLVYDASLTEEAIEELEEKQKVDLLDDATLKRLDLAVFEVQGQHFKVNKAELPKLGKIFEMMTTGVFKEGSQKVIPIFEIEPADFRAILVYHGLGVSHARLPVSDDPNAYVAWWEFGDQYEMENLRSYAISQLSDSATAEELLPLVDHPRLFRELLDKSELTKVTGLLEAMKEQSEAEVDQEAPDHVLANLARGIAYAQHRVPLIQ